MSAAPTTTKTKTALSSHNQPTNCPNCQSPWPLLLTFQLLLNTSPGSILTSSHRALAPTSLMQTDHQCWYVAAFDILDCNSSLALTSMSNKEIKMNTELWTATHSPDNTTQTRAYPNRLLLFYGTSIPTFIHGDTYIYIHIIWYTLLWT